MLSKVVFLTTLAILNLTLAVKPFYRVNDSGFVDGLFEKFTKDYNRTYDKHEKSLRFEYFVEHLKLINKLNAEDQATHDINHFADMSEVEKSRYHGSRLQLSQETKHRKLNDCKLQDEPKTKTAPPVWDWRQKGVVSPVKNQGECGTCWAIATTALVETRYLMQGKKLSLSVQQLLDCTPDCSCGGGRPSSALTQIMAQGGIESDTDYPYEAIGRTCRFDKNKVVAGVKNCTSFRLKDEETLKELLFKEGPLIIAVASKPWETYKHGILENKCEDRKIDHAAQLVGYGTEGETDYWIIKNTWGSDWGEQGFIRIKRGVDCCSILPKNDYSLLTASV